MDNDGSKYKQGVCPCCGSYNLEYDVFEFVDESGYYPAYCNDCKAQFEEWYDLKYDGIYNILK